MKLNRFAEQDFAQRLHGTICRYKDTPYKMHVDGNKIHLIDMRNGNVGERIDARDKNLDVSSVPLGYMNWDNMAVYVKRLPTREIYRQGVCERNTRIDMLGTQKNINGNATIFSNSGYKMITDDYPNLRECLRDLRAMKGLRSVACSRFIALSINEIGVINVYFRNDLVGYMAPNSNTVNVPNDEMGWVVSTELAGLDWMVE